MSNEQQLKELIEGNNAKIAEFMGWKYNKYMTSNFPYGTWLDESSTGHCAKSGLFFHSSWDWLIPVWSKVWEMIGLNMQLGDKGKLWAEKSEEIKRYIVTNDIKAAFTGIANIIEWYTHNQNNNQ